MGMVTGMAWGEECRGLVPPGSAGVVVGLGTHDMRGTARVSAAPTRVCRRVQVEAGAHTRVPAVLCVHNHHPPPPADTPPAACVGTAMHRRAQACSGHAGRCSESTKTPAHVQSCHMPVQAHAHVWWHTRQCRGARDWPHRGQEQDTGLGGAFVQGQWRIPRGPPPSTVPGSGGPAVPIPSCHPPPPCRTPSPLQGLHMGLGQTPAKWASGGGCISKPPAGANAAAPPPGCRPPAPPDPGTAGLAGTVPSPSPGLMGTVLSLFPRGDGNSPHQESWGRSRGPLCGPTLGPPQGSGFLPVLIWGSRLCWPGERSCGGTRRVLAGGAGWGGGPWEPRPATGQSHCVGLCARWPRRQGGCLWQEAGRQHRLTAAASFPVPQIAGMGRPEQGLRGAGGHRGTTLLLCHPWQPLETLACSHWAQLERGRGGLDVVRGVSACGTPCPPDGLMAPGHLGEPSLHGEWARPWPWGWA